MRTLAHADYRRTNARTALLGRLLTGGVVAGAAFIAFAPAAEARQDEELEYEADEGYHEEEWYDPSDWFNEDDATSYEDGSASVVMYDPYLYPVDYTGYWDGYYDGYYDTSFGYDDWDATWSTSYRTTYTDGYFDGYYDRLNEYDYDPYWYTVSVYDPAEDMSADAKKRSADEGRSRGDRASDDESDASDSDRAEAEKRAKSMHRVRGEIASIETAEKGTKDGHAVMKVSFEERDPVLADFGPEMTKSDMPIESGDRATLVGRHTMRDETKVMTVHEVVAGDERYRLRGPKEEMKKKNQAGASSSSS